MGKKEKLLNRFVKNAKLSDIAKIARKLPRMDRGPIRKIWDKVQALYQMIIDPNASWKSKALAIGSLVYLISPLDAIPDVIPLLGLTDDVGVIVATMVILANELKKYLKKNAEEIIDRDVQKHTRKIRITLVASILAITLAILYNFELYFYFRFILLGYTLYELMGFLGNLFQKKKQFDKLPAFLREFLVGQGAHILTKKLKDNSYDIKVNMTLLAILIVLNIIVFVCVK